MRSKEVELAINYFKGKYLEEGDTLSITCDFLDSLDTVLNYISELKKDSIHWRGKYHLLSRKIDVTPNDVIRDKIKKILDILRKHKKDLDYEAWSEYKISGSILFDLVFFLEDLLEGE